jgi:pyruvate formate lyase activating enzyme
MKHEALYYTIKEDRLMCLLCPHNCSIRNNELGFCLARKREGDKLYSENYGILTAVNLDPIEKKPLNMYKPGSRILSAGSFGCNFKCGFCQNSGISQRYLP